MARTIGFRSTSLAGDVHAVSARAAQRNLKHAMKLARILLALLVADPCVAAEFRDVVVPNSLQNVEGSAGSSFPFDVNQGRMQQVYSAAELGNEPGWIRIIGFRMDVSPNAPTLFTTLTNIQVSFSTTPMGVDSLSPVFADNMGLDAALIFSGTLRIAGRQLHDPGGPNSFEVEMTLQNRFFYDPQQGNLLLDITKFPGGATTGSPTAFDAANTLGDSVSGLFASSANATAGTPSTLGLATRFVIDPVPEPSTWALFIIGLTAFALFRRRRRTREAVSRRSMP